MDFNALCKLLIIKGDDGMIKIQRIERHNICRGHPMWKDCDLLCLQAKNLYNYANYIQRHNFLDKKEIIKYKDFTYELKTHQPFKDIGSNSGQHVLKMLERNWKSFFVAIKDYSKYPDKYLGKPHIPKYLKKNGRYVCVLTNMQSQVKNGYLFFAFKRLKPYNNMFRTKIQGKHLQTRIVPKGNNYILEIVYEQEIIEPTNNNNRLASIDLGVNNLITLTNNIGVKPIIINGKKIKADNQYYNKQKAKLQSQLKKNTGKDWSNKLQKLTDKRYWKMEYNMHKISKYVIDWCVDNNIDTLIVGLNKTWKQDTQHKQNFIYIPYDNLIHKITYKAENVGIKVVVTEEAYTSGTSFLDNELPIKENYNISRRITRGLFKSNTGKIINADVNGSLQIIKKVFSNAYANEIEGLDLTPSIVNLL